MALQEKYKPTFNYQNVAANGTTTPWVAPGGTSQAHAILHSICINTKGASANTLSIYDAATATGTPIAIIDTTANVTCLIFDVKLSVGLTIVSATGTPANITVNYSPRA